MVINQLLSDLRRKLFRIGYGSTVTNSCVEVFVKAADLSFLDELVDHINRKYAVSVFVCIYRVISAVSCLVGLSCQIGYAFDIILAILGSTGGLDVVRVALRNDTAGSY